MAIFETIDGINVRWGADGSFYVPRASKSLQKRLDSEYTRYKGELRWAPKLEEQKASNDVLHQFFEGKCCYVIGKGPSIDKLTEEQFIDTNDPIICINESIHVVEKLDLPNPIFAIQQDIALQETCKPERGILLLAQHASRWYKNFDRKIIFNVADYKCKNTNLTVIVVINMLKSFGCLGINFIGFDGTTNQDTGYSESVGYSPVRGGNPNRFLNHGEQIEEAAGDLPYIFSKVGD